MGLNPYKYMAYFPAVTQGVANVMSGQVDPEPSEFGLRLKAARLSRGQSQVECAGTLSNLSGHRVTQPQISDWESGRTHSPRRVGVRAAVKEYLLGLGSEAGEQERSSPGRPDYVFPQYVTAEPVFADLQEQLMRDISYRLRIGPPMSRADALVYKTQLRVLGLPTGED